MSCVHLKLLLWLCWTDERFELFCGTMCWVADWVSGGTGVAWSRAAQRCPLSWLHKRCFGGNKDSLSLSAPTTSVALSYLLLTRLVQISLSLSLCPSNLSHHPNESSVGNGSTGSHFVLVATCVGNKCLWMFLPVKMTHRVVLKLRSKYLYINFLLLCSTNWCLCF